MMEDPIGKLMYEQTQRSSGVIFLIALGRHRKAELRVYGGVLRREDMDLLQKQLDMLREAFND